MRSFVKINRCRQHRSGGSLLPLVALLPLTFVPLPCRASDPLVPTVLHVGDSFVQAGFAQALRPRFQALGWRYIAVAKTSAYIPSLPRDIQLTKLLLAYHPRLVIVTLGANEMAISDAEQRVAPVRRLVRALGSTSCIWTLPPPWDEKGAALLGVIEREASPCRVFDATAFAPAIRRRRDGIHPDGEGGAYWARIFWGWLGVADPSLARTGIVMRTPASIRLPHWHTTNA